MPRFPSDHPKSPEMGMIDKREKSTVVIEEQHVQVE